MYIHAFVFRWVEGTTEEQKRRAKAEILALQGKIDGLLETHVGTNVSPRGQGHEFGGVMKFVDQAALGAYFPHPIHKALGEWLMPLIKPLELDFEVLRRQKSTRTEKDIAACCWRCRRFRGQDFVGQGRSISSAVGEG